MGQKRKRADDADGNAPSPSSAATAALQSFLSDFKALPLGGLGAEEAVGRAQALLARLKAQAAQQPALAQLLALQ